MDANYSIAPGLYPVTPAGSTVLARMGATSERSAAWRGVGLGLEWGGTVAAGLAGGVTFSGLHMFGLIPDSLGGVLLAGLLASGLIALLGLLWKLLGLLVLGLGKLAALKLGQKALRPARFMSSLPIKALGGIVVPIFLVFIDQTGLPGVDGMKLMAPGELLVPFVILAGGLLGTGLSRGVSRAARRALVVTAVVTILAPVSWLFYRGSNSYLFRPDTAAAANLPALSLEGPALPGTYLVESLSYGSGHDRHRAEYGRDVDLITSSVNAQPAWQGFGGLAGKFYRWWYGFDTAALPLNGLVWRPVGQGPFPLVLVVHGNHTAGDDSDPGYAYLCEHLASRGFIAVSVDENFLNGWFFYDGNGAEMPVRAWLLLKHLQEWRKWNADPANVFYGQVDLNRVALMGHSRGGEAATHAAAMNTKFRSPIDKVAQKGEFGFGIQAVVGITPPEGQYRPGGMGERLEDISYLALYGGHDQDLWWAAPLQQYNRVSVEGNPKAFKAVAYIYRANHGQFNTVWGDADRGANSLMLNRSTLLTGAEQRTAGKVFMTSFLEAALMGKDEYRAIFKNPASARNWLPEDIFVTQYEDASFRAVNTNQRPAQQDSIDAVAGRSRTAGMVTARRAPLPLRNGDTQGNNAMFLEWNAGSAPSYALELPTGADAPIRVDERDALTFTLATAMDDTTPVDMEVELRDSDGTRVTLPLRQFAVVPPPTAAQLLKSPPVSRLLGADYFDKMETPYERIMQTYVLPLASFAAKDANLSVRDVAAIRFLWDGARAGKVYLDQVGFTS